MKGFDVIKKKEIANLLAMKMVTDSDIFNLVLDVYNEYQESERDGVDYIFDLNKKEDLITCIKGGLTARMIQELGDNLDESDKHYTQYFYFGCNHPIPISILFEDLKVNLYNYLDELVDYIVAYPFEGACRKLYTILITNPIIED
jgi:hypothetical protein